MTEEEVLLRLQERAPFATRAEARSALQAVLSALRGGLQDEEARALAEELGPSWTGPLLRGGYRGELTCEELYRLTALQGERRLSIATEHAQIVCGVLRDLLSISSRQRLCSSLPQLASLFERSSPPEPPSNPRRDAAVGGHTLADGKPGSSRPLYEAHPRMSQPLSAAESNLEQPVPSSSSTVNERRRPT